MQHHPVTAMPDHVAQPLEWALVVMLNLANALIVWALMRKYTGPGPGVNLLPRTEAPAGSI
jgi:hypothetical protein